MRADERGSDNQPAAQDADTHVGPASQDWGHVLIADDEEEQREVIAELLRTEGYTSDGVDSVQAAVRALTTRHYDLFITDIRMSDNDSLVFLNDLQSRGVTVPVIVLTGQPTVQTAVEAVRHWVVDYLVKPVDIAALSSSVSRTIGKGRLLRVLRKAGNDTERWLTALQSLENALRTDMPQRTGDRPRAQELLAPTTTLLRQLLQSLQDTLYVIHKQPADAPDLCLMLLCNRRKAYEEALRDAVEVLQSTKGSFKSKELGALRARLEAALKASL
ncbi:MAG: response regulator [Nitrospira sp.]|nr:response regulator [Nitrospira sp.]